MGDISRWGTVWCFEERRLPGMRDASERSSNVRLGGGGGSTAHSVPRGTFWAVKWFQVEDDMGYYTGISKNRFAISDTSLYPTLLHPALTVDLFFFRNCCIWLRPQTFWKIFFFDEPDSSDSGEEPILDDESDEPVEERAKRCRRCKGDIREGVRMQCALCDSRWHATCVSHVDF